MFIIEPKLFSIGTIRLHGELFFSYTFNTIVEELTTWITYSNTTSKIVENHKMIT